MSGFLDDQKWSFFGSQADFGQPPCLHSWLSYVLKDFEMVYALPLAKTVFISELSDSHSKG